MLILVAVTISIAVNGGLFEYAGRATGETQNAINAEQQLANGGITIGGVYYNSIDEYLNGLGVTTGGDELAALLKEANMTITLEDILNTPAIMNEVNGLIPVITEADVTLDNTAEVITYTDHTGGIIRTTSEHSNGTVQAWKAFDDDLNSFCNSALGEATGYYLEYEFQEAVYAMQIRYMFANGSIREGKRIFTIQGYDEATTTWEDLTGELTWTGTNSTKVEDTENLDYNKAYKKYRIYVTSATHTTSYTNGSLYSGLWSMQLYGKRVR